MSDEPKRPPSEAWQALEKSALRDEGERVAKLGDAELDASLAGRGVDPEAARKRGAELAARLMAQKGAEGPSPSPAPKVVSLASERARRARPVALTWLAVAAATAAVLGGGGAAYVALRSPEPAPTTPVPSAPPGPSPERLAKQEADTLRGTAATDCAAARWKECLKSLGRAGQLDPAGAAARPTARMKGKAERALFQEELDAKGGIVGPRSLSPELGAAFTAALAKHGGQVVSLACAPGAEPQSLCGALAAALTKAGWVVTRPHLKTPPTAGGTVVHATRVLVTPDADDATQAAADALTDALQGALLRTVGPDDAEAGSGAPLTLVVGPQ